MSSLTGSILVMEDALTFDGIIHQLLVNPDTTIINVLIHPVVFPFILRDRKAFELLSDFHFNFDVTLIVLLELLTFIGSMVGEVTSAILIRLRGFARCAKVANKFLTSSNLLPW